MIMHPLRAVNLQADTIRVLEKGPSGRGPFGMGHHPLVEHPGAAGPRALRVLRHLVHTSHLEREMVKARAVLGEDPRGLLPQGQDQPRGILEKDVAPAGFSGFSLDRETENVLVEGFGPLEIADIETDVTGLEDWIGDHGVLLWAATRNVTNLSQHNLKVRFFL
jgi:hypothetical protein